MSTKQSARMDMSLWTLVHLFLIYRFHNGFSGEECHACHKTSNVTAGGPGWQCRCGAFNHQCSFEANRPHEHPDYGVRAWKIHLAARLTRWITKTQAKVYELAIRLTNLVCRCLVSMTGTSRRRKVVKLLDGTWVLCLTPWPQKA